MSTNILTIYRVETIINVGGKDRSFGPFTARCYDGTLTDVSLRFIDAIGLLMPEPINDDCGCNPSGNQVCGFYSIRLLQEFCPWKNVTEKLLNAGFRIAVYEIDKTKTILGYTQAIFPWNEAKFIKALTYDQMMDLYEESLDESMV